MASCRLASPIDRCENESSYFDEGLCAVAVRSMRRGGRHTSTVGTPAPTSRRWATYGCTPASLERALAPLPLPLPRRTSHCRQTTVERDRRCGHNHRVPLIIMAGWLLARVPACPRARLPAPVPPSASQTNWAGISSYYLWSCPFLATSTLHDYGQPLPQLHAAHLQASRPLVARPSNRDAWTGGLKRAAPTEMVME